MGFALAVLSLHAAWPSFGGGKKLLQPSGAHLKLLGRDLSGSPPWPTLGTVLLGSPLNEVQG